MASFKEQLDRDLETLNGTKKEWANLPPGQKAALLQEVNSNLLTELKSWGRALADAKGCAKDSYAITAELVNSSVFPSLTLNKAIMTLQSLESTGLPPKLKTRELPNGQSALKVWPLTSADSYLFMAPGVEAEVYTIPGEEVTQGKAYTSEDRHDGQVAVVLGAGNHCFLGAMDIISCMVEHRQVVIFKSHPLQTSPNEFTARIFAPLVDRGYLRFATYCKSNGESSELVYHPKVDRVHMTGGLPTHDLIVWGPKEEQARQKADNDPKLKVPMTSELGCITPFIIVAGDKAWTQAELDTHARNVAISLVNNVSCNCCAGKVLMLPEGWTQRKAFMDAVKKVLRGCQLEPPFYPGTKARYNAWKEKYPYAEEVHAPIMPPSKPIDDEAMPYLIYSMDACPKDPKSEYCMQVEPFAPVLNVIPMPASSTEDFMVKAAALSNEMFGTLSCTVVVHPSVQKALPEAVETMLGDLKFGTVALNAFTPYSLMLGTTTWGAYEEGQTSKNCSSGVGVVGNTMLIDSVQKTVYRGPFVGLAVPQPLHCLGVPGPVILGLCGYVVDGFRGVYRALSSK